MVAGSCMAARRYSRPVTSDTSSMAGRPAPVGSTAAQVAGRRVRRTGTVGRHDVGAADDQGSPLRQGGVLRRLRRPRRRSRQFGHELHPRRTAGRPGVLRYRTGRALRRLRHVRHARHHLHRRRTAGGVRRRRRRRSSTVPGRCSTPARAWCSCTTHWPAGLRGRSGRTGHRRPIPLPARHPRRRGLSRLGLSPRRHPHRRGRRSRSPHLRRAPGVVRDHRRGLPGPGLRGRRRAGPGIDPLRSATATSGRPTSPSGASATPATDGRIRRAATWWAG